MAYLGTKIPNSIPVHGLLATEIKILCQTDDGIELKLQCYINHGPEWSVEFSISIQIPYRHFSYCWVLKMFDFAK